MMDYERVKDPEPGRIYEMPLEAWDDTIGGYRNPVRPTEILQKTEPAGRAAFSRSTMEFYLGFSDLLDKIPNKIGVIFIPIFLFTILAEAAVIQARYCTYSCKKIREFRLWSRSDTFQPKRKYTA
jgi:hypothetical protein